MAWVVTFLWNLIQEQRGDIKPNRPAWLFWPPLVSGTAIATTRWRSEDEMWSQVVAQMRALPFVALSEGKFRIADEPEALLSVSWIAARGWVGPLTKGGGFLVAGFSWNTCLCQAVKLLLLVILHPYVMQGSMQSTVHGLYGRGIWLVSPEIRSRLDACLGTLGCLSLFPRTQQGARRAQARCLSASTAKVLTSLGSIPRWFRRSTAMVFGSVWHLIQPACSQHWKSCILATHMREVESGQEELYYSYPVISLESALVSWPKNMRSFRFYFIFLSYSTKHFLMQTFLS